MRVREFLPFAECCRAADISFHTADQWGRDGLFKFDLEARGPGSRRGVTRQTAWAIAVGRELREAGVDLTTTANAMRVLAEEMDRDELAVAFNDSPPRDVLLITKDECLPMLLSREAVLENPVLSELFRDAKHSRLVVGAFLVDAGKIWHQLTQAIQRFDSGDGTTGLPTRKANAMKQTETGN